MTTIPTVDLPAFAMRSDEWQTRGPYLSYRVVFGIGRGITGTKVVVETAATQFADGRLVTPTVMVAGEGSVLRLTSAQALELGAALVEAVGELEGRTAQ